LIKGVFHNAQEINIGSGTRFAAGL